MASLNTIQKININVETNIKDQKPFELTYDKIHNPTKSIVKKPNKDPDYPYFTPDVKYSETVLMRYMKKDYSLILQTFFVNSFFTKMVNESNDENKKKEKKKEDTNTIANHNIYMTLLFLFPTRYPQSANINSSFDKYICIGHLPLLLPQIDMQLTIPSLHQLTYSVPLKPNVRIFGFI